MKKFCIPKEFMSDLKQKIATLSESGQIKKLASMSTKERVDFFSDVITKKEAQMLNDQFEMAVASEKLDALKKWTRDNLDEKYRADETVFLAKNYKNLEEVDNFIESRLALMSEQKYKIALTDTEVAKFTKLGKEFYDESKKIGNNLGNIDFPEENLAWGKKYKALAEYRESLLPTSAWRSFLNNYGKAAMLASLKTPLLNIESNSLNAITEAITRRFEIGKALSDVPIDVKTEYMKFAMKMFKETGVDFTRMINLDDTVTGVGKMIGEETQRIPNKALQSFSDFIFNKTLTTPDVAFSSFSFTDSLGLRASKLAKGDKKLAEKLFRDATNVNATGEAKLIREEAIADARMATYTNQSWSSEITNNLRTVLNKAGGVGDIIMPFVTTVANVAELSATYAGLGFVKGAFGIGKQFIKGGDIDKALMRYYFRDVTRAGLGMSAAYALASQMDVENFMGVYDVDRIKIDQLSNAAYNAVLIDTPLGKRWVNVDYLGPLAAPFVSFMYSKKYGGVDNYALGAVSTYLSQLPAVDANEFFDTLSILTNPERKWEIESIGKKSLKTLGNTISARLIPGLIPDIAKAFDDVQRDTLQKKYSVNTPIGEINLDKFAAKIPFLREGLPKKTDALGRVMFEASPVESLFFGARVKNARMDTITKEIYRLRDKGFSPNIKDIRFMNSTNVDELREKVGDRKFYNIARKYGQDLEMVYNKEIQKESYRKASNEEKKKMLDKAGDDIYKKMLQVNGIKYR